MSTTSAGAPCGAGKRRARWFGHLQRMLARNGFLRRMVPPSARASMSCSILRTEPTVPIIHEPARILLQVTLKAFAGG